MATNQKSPGIRHKPNEQDSGNIDINKK